MGRKKWRLAIDAILVMAMVMAGILAVGCGSEVPPGQITAPVTPSDQKLSSSKLILVGDEPPTLDPALSGDASSARYIVEIFGGLLTLNKNMEIIPDIAESWEVSQDGTVYTFYLRKDVKFHSGKPVTAHDFKWSWERAADPQTISPTAHAYLGDIKGVQEKLAGKVRKVEGVRTLDDYTLQVTIAVPVVYFLEKLTYPASFVVNADNVKSGQILRRPDGTGPFKLNFQRTERGSKIVLERNEYYYRGVAKVKEIIIYQAGASVMDMYENGEIDVAPIGLTHIERVRDPRDPLNKELNSAPRLSISYIGFNTEKPPFDDPKVRQAFAQAINKDQLIRVTLRNMEEKAEGILPPGLPGYNEAFKGWEFNPEKAKQLLSESKYAQNMPSIVLSVPGAGGNAPQYIEAVQYMLQQNLGVKVEIQNVPWATYVVDLHQRRFQMFALGWIADYADPHDFLDILFHSQSNQNNFLYSNPEVDRLLEKARTEKDKNSRLQLYHRAEEIIVNEAPIVPITFGVDWELVKPKVRGYIIPPAVISVLKDVSVEE